MDINYKQDQFELFSGTGQGPVPTPSTPRFIFSSITMSAENIIVLTVFVFLAIIVSFSLGVEKGKKGFTSRVVGQAKQVVAQPAAVAQPTAAKQAMKVQPAVAAPKNPAEKTTVPAADTPQALVKMPESFYTVQLASFASKKFAEQEAALLQKRGYETFVVSKGKHVIVCAGRFIDSQAAKIFSGKLKDKYRDCLVRRL